MTTSPSRTRDEWDSSAVVNSLLDGASGPQMWVGRVTVVDVQGPRFSPHGVSRVSLTSGRWLAHALDEGRVVVQSWSMSNLSVDVSVRPRRYSDPKEIGTETCIASGAYSVQCRRAGAAGKRLWHSVARLVKAQRIHRVRRHWRVSVVGSRSAALSQLQHMSHEWSELGGTAGVTDEKRASSFTHCGSLKNLAQEQLLHCSL